MHADPRRWAFGGVALAYGLCTFALLPWVSETGYSPPYLVSIYGIAISVADLCTVLLLARQYRRDGEAYLLALIIAYLLGGMLAIAHALSFPGAFGPGRVFGHESSAITIFLSWRVGGAVVLLVSVVLGTRSLPVAPPAERLRNLGFTVGGGLLAATSVIYGATLMPMAPFVNGAFNSASLIGGWVVVALTLAAIGLIFTTGLHARPIFGWLALTLTAAAADMTLSTVAGARFTLGWYAARCSAVVSAYLLLAFLAADFARELRDRPADARKYALVGAVALALCAVLLRYFLTPWLGYGIPYATLFGAVAIAVWMGGWGPGLLTAALGYVLARVLVEPAMGQFAMFEVGDALGLALYGLSCALIIALGHNMRAARVRFQRAEERFRKSQEAAIQGYAMLRAVRDAQGRIADFVFEYINPRGAALANRAPEELLGHHLTNVLPGTMSGGLFDLFRKVAESGEPLELELEYDQDRIHGWFRTMIVKVEDGVAVSFFDISQNKRLQRELAQRARQLERADSNKSQFLATLSHELRNPLAPLRNGLAILKRRFGADGGDMVAMMDRQLNQMVRLVDDLLDVSRIDRGKIELRRERVTVDSVISAAIETARPAIDAKSHDLVVRFAQRSLHVEGDPVRLAQIISNLLINAAKFTPPRGRIELGMRAVEGGADRHVEITVRDNGVGIEAEQLPRIFEMFVQLEHGATPGAGGLGLGLALVKSLVELHGGRVHARSAGHGQGAEFVVELPLATEDLESPATRVSSAAAPGGTRVFVVDDNEDAALTLGELLGASGHDVSVFFDAAAALAAAEKQPPQVAFLDLNMPEMDGFELARRMRRAPWGASVRLVAVTGMGRESDVARTREVGFDTHLTKPADPDVVLRLAERPEGAPTILQFSRARGGEGES